MSLTDLTIACIGLGRMGAGIAANIQASKSSFVVYGDCAARGRIRQAVRAQA